MKQSFAVQSEQIKADIRIVVEREAADKERKLREKLIQERDREIEMVIQRLESETYSSSSDIAHRYRIEIERLKSEHAEELKEVRYYAKLYNFFIIT